LRALVSVRVGVLVRVQKYSINRVRFQKSCARLTSMIFERWK
jgi:hypothetical protein